jgi:hypothetical protein
MDGSLWFFGGVAIFCLLVIRMGVRWIRALHRSRLITRGGSIQAIDQFTVERRARLAKLQQPAAKFIDARKSTAKERSQ